MTYYKWLWLTGIIKRFVLWRIEDLEFFGESNVNRSWKYNKKVVYIFVYYI